MKRILQFVVVLVLLPAICLAQWQGPAIGAGIIILGSLFFLHGKQVIMECHNGQMWNVTYQTVLGLGQVNVVEQVEGPLGPCSCPVGGVQIRQRPTNGLPPLLPSVTNTFLALHPRESNCTSGDTSGVQQTVPGEAAAVSNASDSSLSAQPGAGEGLNQIVRGPFRPAVSSPAPQANSGSSFTYTLPFRLLPGGPLPSEATSATPFTCNSSINPTMFRVYHTDNVVDRYDLCKGTVITTINVPQLPLQVRVTPDGAQAIVTSYGGAISFIDTTSNAISGSITNSSDPNFTPSGVAISPNGQFALVTNYEQPPDSYVVVVDPASKTIMSKIPLDTEYPESIFISPDGLLAWITFPWDNVVEVMDILTGTVIERLGLHQPFSIAFNPTGTQAFVSDGGGSVNVLNTSNYQAIKNVAAGFGATDLQMTPDGAYVFVNNSSAGSVTVIDTHTLTGTTTSVGGMPQGSVLVPVQ